MHQSGSTLGELCGLFTRSVAELLVETGDACRPTEGGYRRFKGTAPLLSSTAEGPGEPVRDRYNPAATAASTRCFAGWPSLSCFCEPRAQAIYAKRSRQRAY